MKVVNLEGSRWGLETATIKKGDKEVIKHYLKTSLTYTNAEGKEDASYSKIEIDGSLFPEEEKENSLLSISDILQDGKFDLSEIQKDRSGSIKRHRTWSIIGTDAPENGGILLLGGIPFDYGQNSKIDRIIYDSRCSKGNIIAFSQTFSLDEEGKKVVDQVQFAAQLFPGQMVAYHVTSKGVTKVYCFECINENGESKIVVRTRAPYAWKSFLKSKGFIK